MKIKSLVAVAALVALAAPAFAQQGGGRPQRTPEEMAAAFDKADTNKDGKLSKAEFTASLPAQFADRADAIFPLRDADKDGSISKAEYTAPMAPRPQ